MRSGAPKLPADASGARYQRGRFGHAVGRQPAAPVAGAAREAGRTLHQHPATGGVDRLGRSKFERKIAASTLTVDQLVDRYAELAQVVRPTPTPRIASDPDDDVVIGTALAAKADLLVTGDRPLLSVTQYQGVRIVGVAEAMELTAAR